MGFADWCSVAGGVIGVPISIYLLRFALSVDDQVQRHLDKLHDLRVLHDVLPSAKRRLARQLGSAGGIRRARLVAIASDLRVALTRTQWRTYAERRDSAAGRVLRKWLFVRSEPYEADADFLNRGLSAIMDATILLEPLGEVAPGSEQVDEAKRKCEAALEHLDVFEGILEGKMGDAS